MRAIGGAYPIVLMTDYKEWVRGGFGIHDSGSWSSTEPQGFIRFVFDEPGNSDLPFTTKVTDGSRIRTSDLILVTDMLKVPILG